jgi:hypothetical protein
MDRPELTHGQIKKLAGKWRYIRFGYDHEKDVLVPYATNDDVHRQKAKNPVWEKIELPPKSGNAHEDRTCVQMYVNQIFDLNTL